MPTGRQNLTAVLVARTDASGQPELILIDVAVEDQVPGLDKSDPGDAMLDLDGDGESNGLEFAAATDLLDPDSNLGPRILPGDGGGWLFQWDAVGGESYELFESIDLSNWSLLQRRRVESDTGRIWINSGVDRTYFRLGFE